MKIFLAPFHFKVKLCAHCRAIYYKRNPEKWLGLWEFENLPPLGSFDPATGFRPDYANFLMFDEFVIAGETDESFRRPGNRSWLGAWPELMDSLRSEGVISVVDVQAAVAVDPQRRAAMLRQDLRNPSRWSDAMTFYTTIANKAQNLLGRDPRLGTPDPERVRHDLGVVLSEGPQSDTEGHRALYARAIGELKNHLREVNACLAACAKLKVAPFMWAPYRGYIFDKMHPRGVDDATVQAEASRKFFEIAFPAYAPVTVRDLSKLRRDKRARQLRGEIARAAQTGDSLDSSYPQRVLQEVIRAELGLAHFRRISGWISTIAGCIPIPGLGLAATALNEAVGSFVERRKRAPWRWFYLLSDGRGAT